MRHTERRENSRYAHTHTRTCSGIRQTHMHTHTHIIAEREQGTDRHTLTYTHTHSGIHRTGERHALRHTLIHTLRHIHTQRRGDGDKDGRPDRQRDEKILFSLLTNEKSVVRGRNFSPVQFFFNFNFLA